MIESVIQIERNLKKIGEEEGDFINRGRKRLQARERWVPSLLHYN